MPLYLINAVVWLDTDDEDEAESMIADQMWHDYDDVPVCDVQLFQEP